MTPWKLAILLFLTPLFVVGEVSAQTAPVSIDGWQDKVELTERPDGSIVYILTKGGG